MPLIDVDPWGKSCLRASIVGSSWTCCLLGPMRLQVVGGTRGIDEDEVGDEDGDGDGDSVAVQAELAC